MNKQILTRASKIAKLNDQFRHLGIYTITPGISALPSVIKVLNKVLTYTDFNEDNDPYLEHDFGSFTYLHYTIYFKIDYYNQDLSSYADPLSPNCTRVLTVMRSEEY